MIAENRDPSRQVLSYVLEATLEQKGFPRESDVLPTHERLREPLQRLLDDGRYLVRIVASDDRGALPVRLAATIRGLYETETATAQRELEGLARTRDRLNAAITRRCFAAGAPVGMKALHSQVAADLNLDDFRRWSTVLCSPRLQGRFGLDPTGFYGRSDATGTPGRKSGFFRSLCIYPSFLSWAGLPPREPRRALLLPDDRPRVVVDSRRQVHVHLKAGEPLVLADGLGAHVLAATVERPLQALHSLDLQAHASGLLDLRAVDRDSELELSDEVFNVLGLEFDGDRCSNEQSSRLLAVLRRVDTLTELARSDGAPPPWGAQPAARLEKLRIELQSELALGPLQGDYPLVKNATRVVRRALDDLLQADEFASIRGDFVGSEFITYKPST